jgi:methionine biosynthesis protein MetW
VFARLLAPGDRVLDLGVGDGAILRYLTMQMPLQAFGLDVSPAAIAFCREQGLDVDLADVSKPLDRVPPGIWDYVILSEILEHLPNPEEVVDGLRGRVRKGLLISVPNTGYVSHRVRLLLGRFPLQWVVHPGEHLRFWTVRDFTWWAERLNFTIAARYPYEGVPLLRSWWPSLFAAGIVWVLRDARDVPSGATRA